MIRYQILLGASDFDDTPLLQRLLLFTFENEAEQLPLTMAFSGREKHFQNRVQQIEALGALQRILDLARAAMKCAHVQALWLVDLALHARDEVQSKDIRNCVSVQLAV